MLQLDAIQASDEAFSTYCPPCTAGPASVPATSTVCPTCGAASLPGGTLYALTQGKFGALKKVDPVAVEQEAAVDESKAPSAVSRLITALAYSQNARKYTYIALSMVFFTVVFAINMTHQKPVKMGKDGLPTGNLGMRPESAEALRNAVNPDYLKTPDQGDCPDGARTVRHAHGEYCELNGEKHGPEYTNTCDEDGVGNESEGVWRRGKKHGRFLEKNCEGVVVNDYTYQDGDLVR